MPTYITASHHPIPDDNVLGLPAFETVCEVKVKPHSAEVSHINILRVRDERKPART